jgi:tetratricopeptide (TPR) repeat protein
MVLALVCLRASAAAPSGPDFQDAIAALQRGDSAGAEQKLRAELKTHPDEGEAMSLLGVALDNQKKFPEAAEMHRQAAEKTPNSAVVLNNYGNHLLLTNDANGARDIFLKALAADANDSYADLQLAQLAVKAGKGPEALQHLDKLPPAQLEAPNIAIFRLIALDLADNRTDADVAFHRLAASTQNDGPVSANLALMLVQAGQFEQAETFLTQALVPDPTNFNLLYQLGVVASHAGHNERARDVFKEALRQQPQNVDVMYGLAFVYRGLRQYEQTVRLLADAAKLAPQRADIQKLLAVSFGDLRAFDDSLAAWNRYVALAPDDDTGRRERAFAQANIKQADAGMADLEWYVQKHPGDATGMFELGVAQAVDDPEKGLATLDKAVAIDPEMIEARSARGSLNYQLGKADAALADLEFANSKRPDSAMILDRLGQTYVLLDRLPDAIRALRHAAELAPSDPKTQLHVANALAQAGQTAESKTYMNRYRELGGAVTVPPHGLMDFLNMSPEEQHEAYRARVEKGVKDHPEDGSLQVDYMKLSIGDGQVDQAVATAHKIEGMKAGAITLADAGRAMMAAGQYSLAKELLTQAMTADPTAGLELDLAVAGFHADGAAAGLTALDRVPQPAHGADYFVARADMLDADGKTDDAIAAITQAVKKEPQRTDLYWRAAVLMVRDQHSAQALQLLDDGVKAMPEEPAMPVIRAIVLDATGKSEEASRLLAGAQHQWPEDAAVWAGAGMIQAELKHFEEAHKMLATAISLGAHSAEVKAALAETDAKPSVDPGKLFLTRLPQDW